MRDALHSPAAQRDHTWNRMNADYQNYLREVTIRERGGSALTEREKEGLLLAYLPTLQDRMEQANGALIEAEKRIGRALNPRERAAALAAMNDGSIAGQVLGEYEAIIPSPYRDYW